MRAAVWLDLDEFAIDVVCVERVPMRLRGSDRVEAIRRLSARGLSGADIAHLVMITPMYVSKLQRDNGIRPAPPEEAWWNPRLREDQQVKARACRRRYKAAQRA